MVLYGMSAAFIIHEQKKAQVWGVLVVHAKVQTTDHFA
jgi:hypothetical protein